MHKVRGRREGFSRLGLLSMALLVALCLTGVGYAVWSDETSIEVTMKTGYIEVQLSAGACSDTAISCSVDPDDAHTLVVTLTSPPAGNYTCDFTIMNTGTLPVKIQDIVISGVPQGVAVSLSGVAEGTQIDQAGVDPDSADGTVTVEVQTSCEGTFELEVAFTFVQWNLYVEE